MIQDIDLGGEGLIPLELRFLHDPNETQGYVGIALSSKSSISTNNRFVTLFGYFSIHYQYFFLVMYLSSSRLPKDAVISVYVLVLVWLKREGIEGASDY